MLCLLCPLKHIYLSASNLHPNQGGKFVGFGSAPPPSNNGDDYWSSISSVSYTKSDIF